MNTDNGESFVPDATLAPTSILIVLIRVYPFLSVFPL